MSGEAEIAAAVAEAEELTDLPPGFPVTPLGHDNGIFYFMDAADQIHCVGERALTTTGIALGLVGGRADLLAEAFPSSGRRNNGPSWDQTDFAARLIDACFAHGFFDPGRDVRGPGNWDDGAGGLVIHCGDVVQHLTPDHGTQAPPTWQPAGKRIARRLYVAAYPEPRPADEAADRGEAAELIELFQRFAWTDPGNDPELMAGLAGCALLTGALRIRPVTWIAGPKGSGKSSIFKAIETLAGDGAIGLENATEPGIRKLLESKRVARAVLLDEIEAREDNARLDALIEMARVSYDRDQGRWVRCGADGHAGKIDAIFSFASVEPPPVRPQDASRHVVLELRDLRVGEADIAAFDAGMERIKALAARLRRRMLTRWIEVGATALAIVRRHLVGHGLEPRAADTFAPVLAANFAMLSDDAAPAEIDLERWARVLASRVASSASETTGERV